MRCGSYLFGQILINTLGAWVSDYQGQDILKVINLAPNENLILNTVNLSYLFFFFSQTRLSFYLNTSPFLIFFFPINLKYQAILLVVTFQNNLGN